MNVEPELIENIVVDWMNEEREFSLYNVTEEVRDRYGLLPYHSEIKETILEMVNKHKNRKGYTDRLESNGENEYRMYYYNEEEIYEDEEYEEETSSDDRQSRMDRLRAMNRGVQRNDDGEIVSGGDRDLSEVNRTPSRMDRLRALNRGVERNEEGEIVSTATEPTTGAPESQDTTEHHDEYELQKDGSFTVRTGLLAAAGIQKGDRVFVDYEPRPVSKVVITTAQGSGDERKVHPKKGNLSISRRVLRGQTPNRVSVQQNRVEVIL